ncbi:MAG TPA: hypothetical protein DHW81_02670 [Nitrospiraceae bacterium]|nr:hypothetical protein [Nitrospiraceae bacterium]
MSSVIRNTAKKVIDFKRVAEGYTKGHAICLLITWTILIAASAVWNIYEASHDAYDQHEYNLKHTVSETGKGAIIAVQKTYHYGERIKTKITKIVFTHLILWFVGMGAILTFSKNIGEHQRKITESEWKFRTLSEFAYDWEYWITEDREIIFIAPSCGHITGYTQEEFTRNPALLWDIVHPDDKHVFENHMDDFMMLKHEEIQFRIVAKNGDVKWISHICGPIYAEDKFVGRRVSNRDISDRKNLEGQLIQAQKMESLGIMAGGVAHDFNNLLTAIMGYSSLLKHKLNDGDKEAQNYIKQVLDASEKAQNLTSNLLAFSRKQIIKPGTLNLNEIIKNISGLLKRLIGEDIEFRLKYSNAEFPVFVDSHQIEQVIMNLVANARDAMPAGGILSIETAPSALSVDYTDKYGANPGNYMILSISDTGTGIDKKDMAHIFEPFYTTKEKGKGTGLGLSMVYGIIKQHDGFINIYSEKNMGTTFKVYLPASGENKVGHKADIQEPIVDIRGSETILIAEDENSVRSLLKDTLEKYGYTVIPAVDGADAIEKYKEHKERIDMVIMDVIMPKKNGKEVYDAIKDINPGIKVLFISGYAGDILVSKGVYEEGQEFMAKPLDLQNMLTNIRRILNG